jgi:hypothetical protein
MINYKGKVFSILYPRDQIEEDIVNNCLNCELYGSWNGCQIMRCMNCDTNGCGAKLQGNELNADHPLSANNTYLKDVDWTTIGDIYLENSYEKYLSSIYSQSYPEEEYEQEEEQEYEQEEEQEEEEMIKVFLTENGKEQNWFEMKIAEYDEEQEAEQEADAEAEAEEYLQRNCNERESVFHKINDRFFTETNQFMPAFQDTKSTFWERFEQSATEFAADLDDEISSSNDSSSSTTTYTELPKLEENYGNIYFNIVENEDDSDLDEELQKLKGTKVIIIDPSIIEKLNFTDLIMNTEKERKELGIFDIPNKIRLNEDECV